MKIRGEIVLLCTDTKIYPPPGCEFSDGSDFKMFGCVGARGHWVHADKVFHVNALLHPQFAWSNILAQIGGPWSIRFEKNEDAIFGDSLEEVAMDLQLKGARNVFLIRKKDVELLERDAVKNVGCAARPIFFSLPFKWLKDKCKRIC